jgi:hypothetical protein
MSDFGCSDSEKTIQAVAECALSDAWMESKTDFQSTPS